MIHLLPGEHGEILGRLEVGSEKVACWDTKAGGLVLTAPGGLTADVRGTSGLQWTTIADC